MAHDPAAIPSADTAEARLTRRERVREATLREIKGIARAYLTEHGTAGVSLRAIAREMGMTAPGLYRYFASLRDLLASMRADYFNELADAVAAPHAAVPADDVDGRILASLRAFRLWALAHPAEFALLFGPPGTSEDSPNEDEAMCAAQRFGATFFTLFDQLTAQGRTVDTGVAIPDDLRRQLHLFAERSGVGTTEPPDDALRILVSSWVRLYGVVCMEVFQHYAFVMDDMEPLFEAELRDFMATAGVRYTPPAD
ncbi:TetR family transcriptional regulator [Murinocardiopsis flavida]|uniref:TetR family transcriptional regulator n=1 Tax=Murinocardiopsis flavida TaxID=645275 RepID=A0A2P8DLV5_9ACTN|nr:TetR/AcrR family transcriptional regulator [Murinocardiopsis flavida]PSK98199.1 TetR family transcriptional regulator [Murinocardiopsis flavida]